MDPTADVSLDDFQDDFSQEHKVDSYHRNVVNVLKMDGSIAVYTLDEIRKHIRQLATQRMEKRENQIDDKMPPLRRRGIIHYVLVMPIVTEYNERVMSRYLNPYTDFGFKRLFGEEANKDLLIDFLNTFLPEKHRVKTLEFRNTEQLGIASFERKAIFDIYCEAENGEHFIVEMQKAKQDWFKDRAMFYAAFPIRNQAPKGLVDGEGWDYKLKAVYLIAVLGFEYDQEEERRKLQRNVKLKDQDGDVFYDKLEFIFLQMPLFKKTESELETRQDKWYYFLKNLSGLEQIPSILQEPVFEQAFATAELAHMSPSELLSYEAHLKVYRDNYAVMSTAINEGLRRGLTEGRAEGRAERDIEIARNMKTKGLAPALIAEMTGLSPEEIERL
jgi:predicted transposase/invertase (TIGR01784 family)